MLMRYKFDDLRLSARYPWNDAPQCQIRALINQLGYTGILERIAMEPKDWVSENWLTGERAETEAHENLGDDIDDAVEKFRDAMEEAGLGRTLRR